MTVIREKAKFLRSDWSRQPTDGSEGSDRGLKAPRLIRVHPPAVARITGDTDVPFAQTANQANLHRKYFLEDVRVAANDAPTERALADRG